MCQLVARDHPTRVIARAHRNVAENGKTRVSENGRDDERDTRAVVARMV